MGLSIICLLPYNIKLTAFVMCRSVLRKPWNAVRCSSQIAFSHCLTYYTSVGLKGFQRIHRSAVTAGLQPSTMIWSVIWSGLQPSTLCFTAKDNSQTSLSSNIWSAGDLPLRGAVAWPKSAHSRVGSSGATIGTNSPSSGWFFGGYASTQTMSSSPLARPNSSSTWSWSKLQSEAALKKSSET